MLLISFCLSSGNVLVLLHLSFVSFVVFESSLYY